MRVRVSRTSVLCALIHLLIWTQCDARKEKSRIRRDLTTSGITRHIRSLDFPEASGMGIFFALAIPVDVPDRSVALSIYFEANYGSLPIINTTIVDDPVNQTNSGNIKRSRRSIDRRLVYQVIENKLESYGYSGRACLLRTICESSKFPFARSGLVGDIIRIIFTPSSSESENLHPEIEQAEFETDCTKYEEECSVSLLDVISRNFETK